VPVDRPVIERLIEAKLLDVAHAREHSLEGWVGEGLKLQIL